MADTLARKLLNLVLPARALRWERHDYRWWDSDGDEYERAPWR